MGKSQKYKFAMVAALVTTLGACSAATDDRGNSAPRERFQSTNPNQVETRPGGSVFDLFNRGPEENTVAVNRYIWAASLEVLNFLPVQSVDPFTGVIVTGFGTPPGGRQSYRATVLIDDPALDARSLNVALQTRDGRAVSAATVRAVEDAILSRARELRVSDNRL